jgi:ribose 5-phosphate isomerase B
MADERAVRELVRQVVYRTVGRSLPSAEAKTGRLVTEAQVVAAPQGGEMVVPKGAVITPLARQAAMERKVRLVEQHGVTAPAEPSGARTVALGADHGGFRLKEELKAHVADLGYQVIDCGTDCPESVDYPDFALAVAQLVGRGAAWRGIVVDGAGIGSCMAANKVPGVRAAMCYDQATAVNSREHNLSNVLTLGAGLLGDALARQIVTTWLETPDGADRHRRRVDKIMDIERRYLRDGT